MAELIIAGFGSTYTAYLARAALARTQEQLGIATADVAIILRGDDGNVAIQQTHNRNARKNGSSAFLEALADLLFIPESSGDTAIEVAPEICATVGIDLALMSRAVNQFQWCESALLVKIRGLAQREEVVGLLHGFDGEVLRVPLAL